VTVLPSLSFILIGISVNYPNDSVMCLELPFIVKSDGLLAFHPRALIVTSFAPPNSLALFKKKLEIVKSSILAFRYYNDKNHSSDFDFFS